MTSISRDQRVNDFLAGQGQLFISGRWQMSLSGRTFDTPNPATGARLAAVAEGQSDDIDAAVAAARADLDGPRGAMNPAQRAKILWKTADLIEEHCEPRAEIESLDNGKPKLQAQLVDIAAAADIFRYLAGWCTKLDGKTIQLSPGVDKVAFTGSTEVGKLIIDAARENLTKVTLELGGKAPSIVFADANIEAAVRGAAEAIFFNQGQVCCAGSRLFVESSVYDDVVAGVSEIAAGVKLGDGREPDTAMGPLVSAEQRDRVAGFVDDGIADDGVAVTGGAAVDDDVEGLGGYFYRPTVLTHTRPDMAVVREEIFGPVLVAEPFDDTAQVVDSANDTSTGSPRESGPTTFPKPTAWPRPCRPAPCGSTASTSLTQRCRSADTRSPAGAGRWVRKCSMPPHRPNLS